MHSRIVAKQIHERFAVLSGDRNPMHMDIVAARRTQAGRPVVHGIHTMLWALETAVAQCQIVTAPIRLRTKFLKWVYLGDTTELILAANAKDPLRLQVDVIGMAVLTIDLNYGEHTSSTATLVPSPAAPLVEALDLSFAQLQDHAGDAYTASAAEARHDFPALSALIGAGAVTNLAACSYVVGMEAPGLHSMFSKLDLTLYTPNHGDAPHTALHYAVMYQDERFRKTRVAVEGGGISGTLEVFIRTPPVQQAGIEAVQSRVKTGEFAHVRALIIGGSRGLGELTAKILAAGGGSSTITYALGKVEANKVAAELRSVGGVVEIMQYDVRKWPVEQLVGYKSFTHMFYFATNAIFRPKGELVSASILADFMTFYVQGFYELCTEMLKLQAGVPLVVYYPSSIAVSERPAGMTEYSMAKAAGEEMVRDMNQHLSGINILMTRLPRLPTDQTTGVLPVKDVDPINVMLPIVRDAANMNL